MFIIVNCLCYNIYFVSKLKNAIHMMIKLETISYFDFMILIKCSIGARYVSHSPYDLPFQHHHPPTFMIHKKSLKISKR